jgi:hypothetical protein
MKFVGRKFEGLADFAQFLAGQKAFGTCRKP